MAKSILIVEDDNNIADLLRLYLEKEGYQATIAADGTQGIDLYRKLRPDLVLLDVMMPGVDGWGVLRAIRQDSQTPVIMLTAKGETTDKVSGLKQGADDYITKPFNILEIKARMKAIMRRVGGTEKEKKGKVVETADLKLDLDSRRLFISGREINLTAKEFDLLELMVLNPGKVYSREKLLNTVWGYEYPGDVRTVDVHIRRLREKIESNPSEPKYVHTKWGVGYYFQA